jgi:hypothetical protein
MPAATDLCIIKWRLEGASVKKPINKFAMLLWLLAVFAFLFQLLSLHLWAEDAKTILHETGDAYVVVPTIFKVLTAELVAGAQLAAFGVIIELIDQIRWNALHRAK